MGRNRVAPHVDRGDREGDEKMGEETDQGAGNSLLKRGRSLKAAANGL
jgi:hypothetical protein